MAEQQQMAPSQPMGMFGMSADALKGMGGTPQPSTGGGFFGRRNSEMADDGTQLNNQPFGGLTIDTPAQSQAQSIIEYLGTDAGDSGVYDQQFDSNNDGVVDMLDALLAEQQRFDPKVQPGDDRSGFDPRSIPPDFLPPIGGGGFPPSLPDRPLPPSIVRPGEPPATPSGPFPFGPGHPLFDPPRGNRGGVSGIRPIRPKSKGGLGSIYQKFFDKKKKPFGRRSGNMPMQDMPAVPMPNQGFDLGIQLDRVPFERPGFAQGTDVDINRMIADLLGDLQKKN